MSRVADAYRAWRGQEGAGPYEDVLGFSRAARLDDIEQQSFALSPGRYVGAAADEEDDIAFEERIAELAEQLGESMRESDHLVGEVREALEAAGLRV